MTTGVTLSVAAYDPRKGAVAEIEGGSLDVSVDGSHVLISGDAAGLRDLARWCMVLSDAAAPEGVHAHLDPNTAPLTGASMPILVQRVSAPSR